MENGNRLSSSEGTPQGGNISPILANVYLHYVLDLWFEIVVRKNCRGEAYIVRYCDDFVCCFQYKNDADRFYRALIKRLGKFSLSVAREKRKSYHLDAMLHKMPKETGNSSRKRSISWDLPITAAKVTRGNSVLNAALAVRNLQQVFYECKNDLRLIVRSGQVSYETIQY